MIRSSDRRTVRLDTQTPARLAALMRQYDIQVLVNDADICLHCRQHQCIAVCPTGSLSTKADGRISLDATTCCGCTACVQVCREFNNIATGPASAAR